MPKRKADEGMLLDDLFCITNTHELTKMERTEQLWLRRQQRACESRVKLSCSKYGMYLLMRQNMMRMGYVYTYNNAFYDLRANHLQNIKIYDDCNEIRRKITAFLKKYASEV